LACLKHQVVHVRLIVFNCLPQGHVKVMAYAFYPARFEACSLLYCIPNFLCRNRFLQVVYNM
jgi:hypothetical protein